MDYQQEDFMSTVNAVNMLKLRLSFGYTGNEAIDPANTMPCTH
jgi:hypothetical protein